MDVNASSDDSNQTLSQIAQRHGRSIIDMLVNIQKSVVLQSKSTSFLEQLERLQPIEYPLDNPPRDSKTGEIIPPRSADNPTIEYKFMRRHHVNALKYGWVGADYVPFSYTWTAPAEEDDTTGKYWVENKDRKGFELSPVRNILLHRIINYMRVRKINNLWIDQHSISQTTTCKSSSCSHDDCSEKRNAVHAMDLVYRAGRYTAALLSTCITTADNMLLLDSLLNNHSELLQAETGDPPVTSRSSRIPTKALLATQLFHDIVCDPGGGEHGLTKRTSWHCRR